MASGLKALQATVGSAAHSEGAKAIFENVKVCFGNQVTGLKTLKWDDVPAPVKSYIKAHPKLLMVEAAILLVAVVPGLVVVPVCGALGFSGIGPVAGSAAAAFQSANGVTAMFSTMQSYAMSGYGVAIVNAALVKASGAGLVVAEYLKWTSKK